MPLILSDFTWEQREEDPEHILLTVSFPANKLQQGDLFTSEQFLKISKPPHYWELFLAHPIDPDTSRCTILENEVIFELTKQDPSLHWDAVELQVARAERATRKEQLLEQHRQRLEERAKQRAIDKDRQKKEEIHRQIERESNERTTVERLLEEAKQAELKRMEMAMVKEWRRPTVVAPTSSKVTVSQQTSQKPTRAVPAVTAPAPPPAVRPSGTLQVTFSERTFVTPKRESMEPAEQEWTRKQAAARKAVGFADDDLRPDERNPQWLKQRGDAFFQQKNFLAAIAAYSAGIRLTKDYYALYLNRSAAHIALENYQRCAEDCTRALELLVPAVETNRMARVACLARRGAALVKLGFLQQGYDEMVAASRLAPDDASLRHEVELLQSRIESGSDQEDEDDG
ncbi:dynein assembly factor 4, axonemal-like [Anopheles albimanus]|uniref:Dynein axonemal assembly factor 4 n=1 Tax=Anopheles albimanus TaxID=7167 RepID=A0A182FPW1_ANOAL|nr:dynein assembly factor 4, axonemal-like [Anopheles albimanus]